MLDMSGFNSTAMSAVDGAGHSRNEHEYGQELEELHLTDQHASRAPSCTSVDANTFRDRVDEERRGLVQPERAPAGDNLQDNIDADARRLALRRPKKTKLSGWHSGVRVSAWTATVVGIINTVLLIAGAANSPIDNGIGIAYVGSCDVVNHWATWLHILINGLSSLLLSASNYTMQALSAPTRAEVDKAHAKGDWMDIGVASVRNLSRIKWSRIVLWWILACSSVPIHLLYNSAVFKTIDSNMYTAAVVNPAWLAGGNFSDMLQWQKWWAQNYQNRTAVEQFDNSKCIASYATSFVTGRADVLLITSENGTHTKETVFDFYSIQGITYGWMCAKDSNTWWKGCDTNALQKDAENWTIDGKKIDYCLSQIQPSRCKLQFSIQIVVAVILMSTLKSIAMFVTLYKQKDATLVTIGDAISSYLDDPDALTKGRCLMGRKDVKSWKLNLNEWQPNTIPLPRVYHPTKRRWWFRAASKARWITTFTLAIIAIILTGYLLRLGIYNLLDSEADPFKIGFGTIDPRAFISSHLPLYRASGLIGAVLLANLPQTIVSFLYLLYNSLMTSLLLAREWSQYAARRKPLRVTHPCGEQRSTYYLQLPLRYAGPLLVTSATLHWIISQSIFLVRINIYESGRPSGDEDISSIGYSCPPIVAAMLIGTILLAIGLAMGFRSFSGPMPIASSCSVAIAAACHRPEDDGDAAYLPVQWGAIAADLNEDIGHCAFTSGPVEALVSGKMYAGDGDRVGRRTVISDRQD